MPFLLINLWRVINLKARITISKFYLEEFLKVLRRLKKDHIKASGCENPNNCGDLCMVNMMEIYFEKGLEAIEEKSENTIVEVGD